MNKVNIEQALSKAAIPYKKLSKKWFRADGGDVGEYLTGIVVNSEEEYYAAAVALGVTREKATRMLNSWSTFHLPDIEGYPISASFTAYFDSEDDNPTDEGNFSLI